MKLDIALAASGLVGLLGSVVAVNGFFDGQLNYCNPTGQNCKTLPDWVQLNQSVIHVKRSPGMAGWKLLGSIAATAAFSSATVIARKLTHQEQEQLAVRLIQTELELRKAGIRAQIDLEAFRKQALLESAEAAYAIFEPYLDAQIEEQPLLDGVNSIDPATKLEGGDTSQSSPIAEPVPIQTTDGSADHSSPTQLDSLIKKGDDSALKILDAIVGTTRSTVIAAATGTGKSVSESYILKKFFKRFPKAQVWAISQKNDDFCGLAKKRRVTLFDVLNPEESLQPIDQVWEIFEQRRRTPEHERDKFKDQPVRLILADWHSIYDACRDEKWFQPYLKKLSTIITVGRELNVCLLIDTQSFNLDALGLAKDTNIRRNLNILSQGFTWLDSEGFTQGDYGVIENIITSAHIIKESELRNSLMEQFKGLKEESQRVQRPIVFTTIEPPRLAVLPDLRHYKPGQETRVKLEGYTPEQLNRILSLEFDIELPQSQTTEAPATTNHLAKQILKSWFQNKGWVKVGEARSMCKELRKLTKDADEIRALILELVREESAEFDSAQNAFKVP